jgi:hypothetical protein
MRLLRPVAVPVGLVLMLAAVATVADARSARPRCFGKRATKVGTEGTDRLFGTKRADVIVAFGGADLVEGKDGADPFAVTTVMTFWPAGRVTTRSTAAPAILQTIRCNDFSVAKAATLFKAVRIVTSCTATRATTDSWLMTGHDALFGDQGRDSADGGPGADLTCTAERRINCEYSVVVTVETTGGSVSASPTGVFPGQEFSAESISDCRGRCTGFYSQDVATTLTASADPGYAFSGWSGDCSGTTPCVLSASTQFSGHRVTASFASGQ